MSLKSQINITKNAYDPSIPYKIGIVERNMYHTSINIIVGVIIITMLLTINYYLCKLQNLFNDDDYIDDDRYIEMQNEYIHI